MPRRDWKTMILQLWKWKLQNAPKEDWVCGYRYYIDALDFAFTPNKKHKEKKNTPLHRTVFPKTVPILYDVWPTAALPRCCRRTTVTLEKHGSLNSHDCMGVSFPAVGNAFPNPGPPLTNNWNGNHQLLWSCNLPSFSRDLEGFGGLWKPLDEIQLTCEKTTSRNLFFSNFPTCRA